MNSVIYFFGRCVIALVQALPLLWVAVLGRIGGYLAYLLDARHRRVAVKNVTQCYPDKSTEEVNDLVKENFKRIGESFVCGIKTASMSETALRKHLRIIGFESLRLPLVNGPAKSAIIAIGHFGNFELYVHSTECRPNFEVVATYRGLPHPAANRLLKALRSKSNCTFFDRRFENGKLREVMNRPGVILGLLCDQCAGDRGLQLPFFGINSSTSPAPAVYALRYNCLLYAAICYRTGLGQWTIEFSNEIATHENGEARSAEAIMRDVNLTIENGVRKDPANWFWVHNRWKRGERCRPLKVRSDG